MIVKYQKLLLPAWVIKCDMLIMMPYVTVSAKTIPIGTTIEIHFMA